MRKLILCMLLLSAAARADVHFRHFDDADEPKWQEEESTLPAYPNDKDLVEFYVGPTATNHFFVDAATIDVGKDGVVRYTLVVKTAGGATNVVREGIHCDTREYRLYAIGRAGGTWDKARNEEWRAIDNHGANRHHGALSSEYFCPSGAPLMDADEGRRALRAGRNPRAGGTGGVALPVIR